jgi:hypothetical protein
MDMVLVVLETLRRWWAAAGPYVAVEIVLPGGTLIALLMYLYRRRQSVRSGAQLRA